MNEVVRHPDAGALADDVARRFLALLADVQGSGRVPQVALTGGTIADQTHRRIRALARDAHIDWSRVDVFWGDERFVAADSPDRNAVQAREALLDALPLSTERVHEIPAADGSRTVSEAASSYADTLRSLGSGAFDLVMLGLGPDGHVASLFPGFSQLEVDDQIAVAVTGSPKPPPERVSLTFPALNRTATVWFMVSGEEKADAVRRALAPEGSIAETPARGVRGRDSTLWFLDSAAASAL